MAKKVISLPDSYLPFSIISHFTLYMIFIISVTPADDSVDINLHGKITKLSVSWLQSLCFSHKEINSYNEKIVQFGSVNSSNVSPLTELITTAIEGTAKLAPSVWSHEPRTSELDNLVFSRQTGVQSASIRFRLINRWSDCTKRTAIKPGFKTVSKNHMLNKDLTRLMQSLARVR